jgi:hypothetical protein
LLDKKEIGDSEINTNERKTSKKYQLQNRKQVFNKSNENIRDIKQMKVSCDNLDYLMTELNQEAAVNAFN